MAKKKRSRKTKGAQTKAAAPAKKETRAERPKKKSSSAKGASRTPVRKQPNAIQRFIRETRGELRKVTWPTREEALQLTKAVLLVTFAMSAFLGLMDWVFNKLFGLLFGLFS